MGSAAESPPSEAGSCRVEKRLKSFSTRHEPASDGGLSAAESPPSEAGACRVEKLLSRFSTRHEPASDGGLSAAEPIQRAPRVRVMPLHHVHFQRTEPSQPRCIHTGTRT